MERDFQMKEKIQTLFGCLGVNLSTVKIWGAIGQISFEF